MDLGIAGNAALVTASSEGLGKASATALAMEGVDVVVNGRDEDRLEATVEEIREVATGAVVGQPGDITLVEDIDALVDRTVDEFGRLDHLVTSAGGPPRYRPLQASDEDWYQAFELLVMSVVRAVRAAEPHLRADGGGSIVNITSRVVKAGRPGNVLSSAVRMAVIGYEKTLSVELAPEIRSNAILPGAHETQRLENGFARAVDEGQYDRIEDARAARAERIPLKRTGDPMELGRLVAYISSGQSGFVNGQAIVIDGGSTESTF